MIKIEQNSGYGADLWITPYMTELVNEMNVQGEFSVGLIPAGYDCNAQQASLGDFGYIGPSIPRAVAVAKPKFHADQLTLDYRVQVKTVDEEVLDLVNQVYVRPGGRGNTMSVITQRPHRNVIKKVVTRHLYIKDCFEAIYEHLRQVMPNLTKDDLLDVNFSNREWIGDQKYNPAFLEASDVLLNDVYKTIILYQYEDMGIDYYDVTLSFMSSELERNKDVIIQIINLLNKTIDDII